MTFRSTEPDRGARALKHIALSDIPPPPYLEFDQLVIGRRVQLRVQFEDTELLAGNVVGISWRAAHGGGHVLYCDVMLDDCVDGITVRSEWLW